MINSIKKKMTAAILFLLLLVVPANIYASDVPVGSVNYFSPMIGDEYYGALLKHIFNGGDITEAVNLYSALVASLPSSGYELWLQEAALARACLILARDAAETGPEYDLWAETFMNEADKLIRDAERDGAPESVVQVLDALSFSFWYLVDGSLSKAMKFPSMADDTFEAHPEDIHALLLDADRYLHSPGIVGGNKRRGLEMFQTAENVMNEYEVAEWDRFTILSGLAVGYDKNNDKEKARTYAEEAYKIYTADSNVNSILGL